MKEVLAISHDEQPILSKLSEFDCKLNPDVERFLKVKAIPYEKAHKCRTYLIVDSRIEGESGPRILAYVSVALSNLKVKEHVSKTMRKRLDGIFPNDEIPCYLIGQLGKNDRYSREIEGCELIDYAMNIIRIGHGAVGGRFVRIDVKRNDKLIRFYEENGFRLVQEDDELDLIQFARFF